MSPRDHFRAHGRRPVALDATLLIRGVAGTSTDVQIRDLGLGGARLEVAADAGHALAVDTAVTLEVVTPTLWDPLVLRGRVAWSRPGVGAHLIGVRFEHRDGSAVFALFQLVGAQAFEG